MLDSAWGKAMNLNFNGLPEIDLPGDHFSPGGAYFDEDVTETPLVAEARRVHASATASQPASPSTGRASSAWAGRSIGWTLSA